MFKKPIAFDPEKLDGKSLKIAYTESSGRWILSGIDKDGNIYVMLDGQKEPEESLLENNTLEKNVDHISSCMSETREAIESITDSADILDVWDYWVPYLLKEIRILMQADDINSKLVDARNEILNHPILHCDLHGICIPHAKDVLDGVDKLLKEKPLIRRLLQQIILADVPGVGVQSREGEKLPF